MKNKHHIKAEGLDAKQRRLYNEAMRTEDPVKRTALLYEAAFVSGLRDGRNRLGDIEARNESQS